MDATTGGASPIKPDHAPSSEPPPPAGDGAETATGSEQALATTTMTTAAVTANHSAMMSGGLPQALTEATHNPSASSGMPSSSSVASAGAHSSMASASMQTAVTPTTTFGANAQMDKPPATLTPMGESKVSGSVANAAQKPKETKKKGGADAEPAKATKKASPRVRGGGAANKGGAQTKGEKRKASPSRSNGNANPSAVATMATATGVQQPTAPQMTHSSMGAGMADPTASMQSVGSELTPSQDNELRKAYLQRIYRQLQMTHRNQDDTMVRRLATNIEIEVCRRATTRNEYISLLNQEINRLMQAELNNGAMGVQQGAYGMPGQSMPGAATSATISSQDASVSGMQTHALMSQASSSVYSQGSPSIGRAADGNQRAPTQGSFMSLLSGQSPMQGYDQSKPGQQYASQPMHLQSRTPHYASSGNANVYPGQGQVTQSAAGEMVGPTEHQASPAFSGQPRTSLPQSAAMAPPEFAAQFQRFDKSALVELLWTQHKSLLQWQRRVAQLEMQLGIRPNTAGVPPNAMAQATASQPGAYYNASPRPGHGGVSPALSAEAEAQRANDRRNSRGTPTQQQQPYHAYPTGQAQYGASPGSTGRYSGGSSPPTPTSQQGALNPALYWDKVRYLKESFLRPLYFAHQALSQHSAPPSSAQSVKAENVKHNITLATSILSEQPKNLQPRPIEVLDSIERFIQSTVVPIVRKVHPQMLQMGPQGPDGSGGYPVNAISTPNGVGESQRYPVDRQPGLPTPTGNTATSGGVPIAPGAGTQRPELPSGPKPATGGAKSATAKATKSGGRKSPANGTKKTTTPKNSAKGSGGKKSPARASGAKQTAKAAKATNPTIAPTAQDVPSSSSVSGSTTMLEKPLIAEDPLKERGGLTSMKSDDEGLNDFADFADLDFGDDLQDPLAKVQYNKENASGQNSRKRSIEDV